MARILVKRKSGEPTPGGFTRPWGDRTKYRRGQLRPKLSVRMLRKTPVEDAAMGGVATQTRNAAGTQSLPAGTQVNRGGVRRMVRKVVKMDTSPAKGTKVISPPNPTNRGGVRNPYTKRTL